MTIRKLRFQNIVENNAVGGLFRTYGMTSATDLQNQIPKTEPKDSYVQKNQWSYRRSNQFDEGAKQIFLRESFSARAFIVFEHPIWWIPLLSMLYSAELLHLTKIVLTNSLNKHEQNHKKLWNSNNIKQSVPFLLRVSWYSMKQVDDGCDYITSILFYILYNRKNDYFFEVFSYLS